MRKSPKMLVLRRLLTASLTGIAFWNSYEHTVDWFAQNGQEAASKALALIPEGGVVLVILSLALDHLTRAQKVILGGVALGSVSVTLTANLAAAPGTVFGVAAALVAPLFAIAGFGMELLGEPGREPVSRDEPVGEPVAAREPEREPVDEPVSQPSEPGEPVGEPVAAREPEREPVSQPGEPQVWDRESVLALAAEGRSTTEIVLQTGVPKATVNRWKREAA